VDSKGLTQKMLHNAYHLFNQPKRQTKLDPLLLSLHMPLSLYGVTGFVIRQAGHLCDQTTICENSVASNTCWQMWQAELRIFN